MLSAVVIVLMEVLEASILIAIMLVIHSIWKTKSAWFPLSVVFGLTISCIAAYYSYDISESFYGIGQELMNASSLLMVALLLFFHHCAYPRHIVLRSEVANAVVDNNNWFDKASKTEVIITIVAASLAIQRECTEVIIYLVGFSADMENFPPIVIGSIIGAMIGLSCGVLVYYGIGLLSPKSKMWVAKLILMLIASGLMSQSVLLLIQAGLVDTGTPVWDSSHLVSENSITGQLLFATLGYEATPYKIQIVAHWLTLLSFLLVSMAHMLRNRRSILMAEPSSVSSHAAQKQNRQ